MNFEYKIVAPKLTYGAINHETQSYWNLDGDWLNEKASEGWELVCFCQGKAIFKKPKDKIVE